MGASKSPRLRKYACSEWTRRSLTVREAVQTFGNEVSDAVRKLYEGVTGFDEVLRMTTGLE
jgi:hypothetical protein